MEHSANVEVKNYDECINVYIRGVLHLSVKKKFLTGIQSWGYTKRKEYYIEYHMAKGKNVLSSYDNRDTWVAVLNGLNSITE